MPSNSQSKKQKKYVNMISFLSFWNREGLNISKVDEIIS